jgi:hypothetical protein
LQIQNDIQADMEAEDDESEYETECFDGPAVGTDEFRVNDLLTVRFDGRGIYMLVNGQRFNQCVYPALYPDVFMDSDQVEGDPSEMAEPDAPAIPKRARGSVDANLYHDYGTLDHPGYEQSPGLPPETLFWGLCSSLQAWAENNYDSRLLHVNLAFPIARALARAGDEDAKAMYEREVVTRWKSDFEPVQVYLAQGGFLRDLSPRCLIEIILHGGLDWALGSMTDSVACQDIINAWCRSRSKRQLALFAAFSSQIDEMDQQQLTTLLAKSASPEVAIAVLQHVTIDRLDPEQLAQLKMNRRVATVLASVASVQEIGEN